nr:uncharacterized protein LOC109162190 isoform X2 [Ipomoea trifida]
MRPQKPLFLPYILSQCPLLASPNQNAEPTRFSTLLLPPADAAAGKSPAREIRRLHVRNLSAHLQIPKQNQTPYVCVTDRRVFSGGKRGKLSEDSSPANKKVTVVDDENNNEVTVERSPGLPPELRRGGSAENAKKTRPSALVVRLMGLEEEKKCSPEGETLTEVKRKMLLKALDKCNQDLEALKKIIKAVESSSSSSASGASTPAVETCKKKSTAEHQLLSPISVLDEQMISRSPPLTKIHDNAIHIVQRSKKAGTDYDSTNCILKKFTTSSFPTKREAVAASPVMWCSKAMVQSVEEVCRDIACGEHREAGKIGLVLQDYICADLIQELVKDLGSSSPSPCTEQKFATQSNYEDEKIWETAGNPMRLCSMNNFMINCPTLESNLKFVLRRGYVSNEKMATALRALANGVSSVQVLNLGFLVGSWLGGN